jgi:hydrogenase/urease accessory protein HupE
MNRPSTAPARSGYRWRVIAAPLVMSIITWLYPASALAHGNLAIGDFYTGMLHPFLHFETLLPTLALALWSGQLREPHAWRLPLVFLGAALLGAVAGILEIDLRLGPTLIRLSMLVLGLLVAARAKLPAWMAISMVFLFGIYHGQANTYEPGAQLERPLLFIWQSVTPQPDSCSRRCWSVRSRRGRTRAASPTRAGRSMQRERESRFTWRSSSSRGSHGAPSADRSFTRA